MANPSHPDDAPFDVEATINDLDRKITRLRILYEQYFLGIEKRAPENPLKQVVRLIHILEQASIRNTSLKFRFQSLVQKFQSYRSYWFRTVREIENGTYHRHVAKAKAREQRLAAYGEDFEVEGEDAEDPFATPLPELPRNERAATEAADLAEDFLRQLGVVEPAPAPRPAPRPAAPAQAPAPAHDAPTAAPIRGMSADDAQRRAEALKKLQERLGQRMAPGASSLGARRPTGEHAAIPAASGSTSGSTPAAPRTLSRPTLERPIAAPAADAADRGASPHSRRTLSRPAIQRPAASATASPQPAAQAGALADDSVRSSLERSGLTEKRLQNIYENLVDAKRRCNEPTTGLSYDNVVRSIAKQAPALQQKSADGKVDFQVVVKEGKAYLKPVTSRSHEG